jgi:hypothetical protein
MSSSTNATEFCQVGNWNATQTLIAFLGTNIIAHAATVRLPAGASRGFKMFSIVVVILQPVFAGEVALHSVSRWWKRWRQRWRQERPGKEGKTWITLSRGYRLEDAATSGAVAIFIPLQFVPLVKGRWDQISVGKHTKTTLLGDYPVPHAKKIGLPFKPAAHFPRYVPFAVPPNTKFKGELARRRIHPSSSVLSYIIGLAQAGVSARQLYLNYKAFVGVEGLSSPYLVVIPYMLMSLVNLIANLLLSNFRQVTIIPWKNTRPIPLNEVYIVNFQHTDGKKSQEQHKHPHPRVLAVREEVQLRRFKHKTQEQNDRFVLFDKSSSNS